MANNSPQQQAIIDWALTGTGSLIIQARAGTGKTTTLLKLVEAVTRARKGTMLLCAYNKSISLELQKRLTDSGVSDFDAEACTLHSAGFRIIRRYFPKIEVDEKKVQKILFEMLEGDCPLQPYFAEAGQSVSLAKQTCGTQPNWLSLFDHFGIDIPDEDVDEVAFLCQRVLTYSRSQDTLRIDFDDMILTALDYKPVRQYDWVLLDEAQDTNPARRALAKKLLKPGGRFIAVGDDRQAIYGFTGADSTALDLIREEFQAVTLPLTVSYRCPKTVIEEAQRYVPDIESAEGAPAGALHSWQLVARVEKEGEFSPAMFRQEDAILCRLTAPLLRLAYSMIKLKIPCKVEGRDIGLGLKKLATKWKVANLDALAEKLFVYRERQTERLQRTGREAKLQRLQDQVDSLIALTEVLADEGYTLVSDLLSLIEKMFGDTREEGRILTLSTIHKAKGREWDRVFILHRYMPSPYARKDWQVQQEQNLAYVAVTRAKKILVYLNDSPY